MGKENEVDILLRCSDCNKLVSIGYIHVYGGCNHCGNKRLKSIMALTPEEHAALKDGTYDLNMKDYKVDAEWLAEWEEVGDE